MRDLLSKDNRSYLMGISIIWIIVFHFCFYGLLLPKAFFGTLFSRGYVGVDVFLFLSAYGLGFSYEKNSLLKFYYRRAIRLFPMYFLFLAVCLFFFGKDYQDPISKLVVFQCTGLASFRQVDFEWYVPALIILYLLYPLLYKGFHYLYKKEKWLIPAVIVLFIFAKPLVSKYLFSMFAYRIPVILLGIVTFFAIKNNDSKYLLSVYLICSAVVIAAKIDDKLMCSVLIPVVLWMLAQVVNRFPMQKFVCFAGKHSLELYLAQCIALNHYFLRAEDTPFILKSIIAFAVIVVFAIVLYYFQNAFVHLLNHKKQ